MKDITCDTSLQLKLVFWNENNINREYMLNEFLIYVSLRRLADPCSEFDAGKKVWSYFEVKLGSSLSKIDSLKLQ